MLLNVLMIGTTMVVAVAMALSLAHALELPGKMRLGRDAYYTTQRIYYPGFTFGGIAEPVGSALTLAVVLLTPRGTADSGCSWSHWWRSPRCRASTGATSDFNVEQDRGAAAAVLAMRLPTTLIPHEVGRRVALTRGDLDRLAAAGGAPAWVAGRARGWLDFWTTEVGIGGFYPFDALAAAYAIDPTRLHCARASAWVGRDERLWGWLGHPRGLLVGLDHERPREIDASGQVVYCPGAEPALGEWMIGRLAAPR